MAKQRERSEVEHLRAELRKLKSENKHLRKELGRLSKRPLAVMEDLPEPKLVAPDVCPLCQKGQLKTALLGALRQIDTCSICEYRKVIKL